MTMIDSVNQISAKAKMELVSFLQPFFNFKGRGGDGIRYNEDNQELALRYLESTTNQAGPTTYGTAIRDETDGAGILIESTGDESNIDVISHADVKLQAVEGDQIVLEIGTVSSVVVQSAILQLIPVSTGDNYAIVWTSGGTASGKRLLVKDEFNAPLFAVDADGDIHIPVGKNLIADL